MMSASRLRTSRARVCAPRAVLASASLDMTSAPAPIWGFSSCPSATRLPCGVTARQCRLVVPRSTASSRVSPAAGMVSRRGGRADGAGRAASASPERGACRMRDMRAGGGGRRMRQSGRSAACRRQASLQPAAGSSGLRMSSSAGRGAGAGERKRTRQRPQWPRPEHRGGAGVRPDSQMACASV